MHQGGLPAGQVAHDSLKRSKGQSLGLSRQSVRPRGRWESEDDHMCAPAGRPNGLAGPPPEEEARRPLAAASPSAAPPAPRALPVPSRTAVASLQHLGRRVPAPRASRSVRVRARHTVTQDRATRGHSGAFHQDLGVGPPRDRAVGAGYQLEAEGKPASQNTGPRCRAEEGDRAGAHGRGGRGARTRFKTAKSGDAQGTAPAGEGDVAAVPSTNGLPARRLGHPDSGSRSPGKPHLCLGTGSHSPSTLSKKDSGIFTFPAPTGTSLSALTRTGSII